LRRQREQEARGSYQWRGSHPAPGPPQNTPRPTGQFSRQFNNRSNQNFPNNTQNHFQNNSLNRRPQNRVTFNDQNGPQNFNRPPFQRQHDTPEHHNVQVVSEHDDDIEDEAKND
jgi:hypothetical protein